MFDFKRVMATLMLVFAFEMSQSALAETSSHQPASCPEQSHIDWSKVPGPRNNGPNDVTRDFVNAPDPLNDVLSNDFTAWYPQQRDINGAFTSTGKAQRQAAVGSHSKQTANDCGKA